MSRHQSFIHHVFFWLKNAKNQEDQAKLVAGLEKLRAIADITGFHIGIPALQIVRSLTVPTIFHYVYFSIRRKLRMPTRLTHFT